MAKASKLLEELAKEFESPDNEILIAAEGNPDVLGIVAHTMAACAQLLKATAVDLLKIEPHIDADDLDELAEVAASFDGDANLSKYSDSIDNVLNLLGEKNITKDLENIGNLATALDESGNDELSKIASVLDEILLTIGAPKGSNHAFKAAEEAELDKLRAKYYKSSDSFFHKGIEDKDKKVADVMKEIDDKVKVYKPMEAPLSSRSCPDHPGVMLMRVGDHVSQCLLDKKIYNYDTGYALMDGTVIPPSSVQGQTGNLQNHNPEHITFSTREEKLNG